METSRVYLLPGELCVSREPANIDTLLGSCVAVCLYNRRYHFGGMNHFMLPSVPPGNVPSTKHGDYSTRMLIEKMKIHDPVLANVEALVMGGGNVTGHLEIGQGIGARNIITARDILQEYNIRVTRKDIGGVYGRKVFFKNWTGEVEVRKIEKSAQASQLEARRRDLSQRRIKVLIVDDSATIRDIIAKAVEVDPEIEVVGQAANPYEAREMILETNPDVICLDVIMPKMDGITFLKKLFVYSPKPVIMISTVVQKGSKLREQAEKIGAVEVIDKEDLQLYKGMDTIRKILISKIKTASRVWVKKKSREELQDI